MRTLRQHKVDLAVIAALSQIGDYILPQSILTGDTQRLVVPRPSVAEVEAAIRYHEDARRIVGVAGETEQKWKITDAGRAYYAEHA